MRVLYQYGEIISTVRRLARAIDAHYEEEGVGEGLVLVGVLKGAYRFLADLSYELTTPHEIEFVQARSYEGTTQQLFDRMTVAWSPGADNLAGKQVLLVEDIVDNGLTMVKLLGDLQRGYLVSLGHGPKANLAGLHVVSLLHKDRCSHTGRAVFGLEPYWVGRVCPDEFVVGYGLDYNERFRDLNDIMILEEQDKRYVRRRGLCSLPTAEEAAASLAYHLRVLQRRGRSARDSE